MKLNFKKSLLLIIFIGTNIFATTIENSVVKIYATISEPDQLIPWQSKRAVQSTGSGVLIKNRYILTSAHVVQHSTFIEIKKQSEIQKYEATVKYISYKTDLALLKVKDAVFYDDIKPLKIGKLPYKQDEIKVIGYPRGGKDISITKGIVSRIEYSKYSLSNFSYLTIQIDAPINHGNSGGPVLNDKNKIVGIAMQALKKSEGIGYIVPTPVINQFLKDIEDGIYDGMPNGGIGITQNLLNKSIRNYYKMNGKSGILLSKILKGSFSYGILKDGDVLLSIDNNIVQNDATIKFRDSTVFYSYAIHKKQIGDSVEFNVLRDGGIKNLKLTITKSKPLIKNDFKKPKYFIFGGLVFRPVTSNYIKAIKYKVSSFWYDYYYSNYNQPIADIDELVYIQNILPNSSNSGYQTYNSLVKSVNGIKVKNLRDLVSIIENNEDEFVVIKLYNNSKIVLNHKEVLADNHKTLKNYDIANDRNFNEEFQLVLLRAR